jgi:hypothetical protein
LEEADEETLFGLEDDDQIDFDKMDNDIAIASQFDAADQMQQGQSTGKPKSKPKALIDMEAAEGAAEEPEEYDDYEAMKDFVVDDDGAGCN